METKLRKYPLITLLMVGICWIATSCHVTRYVQPGEYLLKNPVVIKGAKDLDLTSAIRTKPNRRMISPKVYLSIYNFGTTLERDSSLLKRLYLKHPKRKAFAERTIKWLKYNLGEPPILLNKESITRDSLNLLNAYAANGYFDTQITPRIDTIDNWFDGRKANVYFDVQEGQPFHIRRIYAEFENQRLAHFYKSHPKNASIKAGNRFTYTSLAAERNRITQLLRDDGYFAMNPNLITFRVDTFLKGEGLLPTAILVEKTPPSDGTKWLDLVVEMENDPQRYTIDRITVELKTNDYNRDRDGKLIDLYGPALTAEKREELDVRQKHLTDSCEILFKVSPMLVNRVNYNFLAERVYFKLGKKYMQQDARRTQSRLQELSMLQYVIVNYNVDDSTGKLAVFIESRMTRQFQLRAGTEAYTNDIAASAILPIGGASLSFRNKNTFKKSELLVLSGSGDVGLYPVNDSSQKVFWQIQGKGELNFPRFLLPFPKRWLPVENRDLNRYRPVTNLSVVGLREQREEFSRFTLNGNWGYRWFNRTLSDKERTQLSPMSIEYIDVTLDSTFKAEVVDSLPSAIRRSFTSRFNSRLNLGYTISDYGTSKLFPTTMLRFNYEGGGNVPYLIELLTENTPEDHTLFIGQDAAGLSYGQYIKLSMEGRAMFPLKKGVELVLRGAIGGSAAYNFTQLVPPQSRFYSGGSTSMRGWQSNTLGPGKLSLEDIQGSDANTSFSSLLAPGGEYLIEANAELRFDVWSYLEMAIFSDVGNVWFNNPGQANRKIELAEELGDDPDDPRSTLRWKNFFFGWDVGVGFRLDFSFLIIRIDLAQQLFAPDLVDDPIHKGWVIRNFRNDLGGSRFQYQLGIGYPF